MSSPHHIVLNGEYDVARKEEFAQLLASLDGDAEIIFDMSEVTYVDSSILSQFAALRQADAERSITFAGVHGHIRRVFDIVGFDEIFYITD